MGQTGSDLWIYTLQRKCSNSVIKGSYPEQIISLYGLVWFNLNCWAAYLVICLLFLSACLCLCIPYRLSFRQIYPAAESYVTAVSKYHSQYGGQSWGTPNLTASLTLANSPRVYRLCLNFLLYLILLFKNCCHDCSSADGLVAGSFQWLFPASCLSQYRWWQDKTVWLIHWITCIFFYQFFQNTDLFRKWVFMSESLIHPLNHFFKNMQFILLWLYLELHQQQHLS